MTLAALGLLQNVFIILTMSSWSNMSFFNNDGTVVNLHFDEGGLFFISLIKSLMCLLIFSQGYHALKTFKPILKEEQQSHIFVQGANEGVKHSKQIKLYKKRVVKIVMASLALMFLGTLFVRCFLIDMADNLIDQEYNKRDN